MDNETLQNLIYKQLFSAEIYKQLAAIAPDQETKDYFLLFEKDCHDGVAYLNYLYQINNTSSFNPIIRAPDINNEYNGTILYMIRREGDIYREFFRRSFLTTLTIDERTTANYLAGICLNHSTILTNLFLR